MSDLLSCLFQYTMEHLTMDTAEYEKNCAYSNAHLQKLKVTLDESQLRHLDDYINMSSLAEDDIQQAIFRDALGIGVYLGTLHHP